MSEGARRGAASIEEEVQRRIRWFAVLRAAQRAIEACCRNPLTGLEAVHPIREQLRDLLDRVEKPEESDLAEVGFESLRGVDAELFELDGIIAGYAATLRAKVETIPLAQLRATLSVDSHALRAEALALLELCIGTDPSRTLRVIDFLVTLLCTTLRDGVWIFESDPVNLSDAVRQRCDAAPPCGPALEKMIVGRFQEAAERLAREEDGSAILRDMSSYKLEIEGFFFVPTVLRCIVGYNAAARNHLEARLARRREHDTAIDAEMGLSLPVPEDDALGEGAGGLPPHQSPGVIAVQEAIARRLAGQDPVPGAASRIAARLDVSLLERADRDAFASGLADSTRILRMTVVLGHLAMVAEENKRDIEALGLHDSQLDAWICELGDEVQAETNKLLREDLSGALHLGDTKSRFLTAVLLVARRRHDPERRRGGREEPDTFTREAIELVRAYLLEQQLHKPPKAFVDLLGGGWRRTVALTAVFLIVAWIGIQPLLPTGPRPTRDLPDHRVRDLSPYFASAYRDHAKDGSMFVATVNEAWNDLSRVEKRHEAEEVMAKLYERNVAEFLLYDPDRALIAHYKGGRWRSGRAWEK